MVTFGRGTDDDSQTADPGGGTDPSPTTGRGNARRSPSSDPPEPETVTGATTVSELDQRQRDLTRGRGPTIQTPGSERSSDALDPDARPPTAEQRQQIAEQTRFEADEIAGVSPTDDGLMRVTGTADARERIARENFAASRPSRGGGGRVFGPDEMEFEATGGGVTARPTREARQEFVDERTPDPVERQREEDEEELGTIADAPIPATDSTALDALDRGGDIWREQITDRAASAGRTAGEADIPVGPAGPVEGSEARGQLGEDFGRTAAASLNVPAFGAGVLRVGGQVDEFAGDPDRARQAAAGGAQVAGEAGTFARENPGRAAAMTGGFLAGAGIATGASRLVRSPTTRTTEPDAPTTQTPDTQPGTGGTGTLLDPSDVRQPASQPQTVADGGLSSQIQRELDSFLADTRGQVGTGRTRQRPDQPDTGGGIRSPSEGRDVLGGSPRDRLSGDVTRRQRQDLETARGTFDMSPDPIAARGTDRGLSPGSRVPRDPLDTRGGRVPDGSSGLTPADIGLGGAAGFTGLTGASDATDDMLGFDVETMLTPDSRTGTTPEQRTGPTPDTTTGPDTGQATGQDRGVMTMLREDTALSPRTGAATRSSAATTDESVFGEPGQADPTGRPGARPRPRPRPRPRDGVGLPLPDDDDETEAAFDADDAVFETGILDGDEALEDAFGGNGSNGRLF